MKVMIVPPPAASHVTTLIPPGWASGHQMLVAGPAGPDLLADTDFPAVEGN